MRTRTLLLLAVACGLVILVAGSIQLMRVTGGQDVGDDLSIGQRARAADLVVTVLDVVESNSVLTVAVWIGGVDDPTGIEGFRLLVPGAVLEPIDSVESTNDGRELSADRETCLGVTVAVQSCTIHFDTSAAEGATRVLLLRRGEDQNRWSLESSR